MAFLVLVVMAGLATLTAVLGPWSLITGLSGIGGTAIARTLRRRLK
ncbi:hypothetical protein [Amycolatopsis pigmentata]|uniref:Secreted protein n=1 Tax=Amycolatopsis pigmentata TaxID=450801 RepID=A0ABW5FKV1_9PSEU